MKPGENERTVQLLTENMPTFFEEFFPKMITCEEDLKKPVGDLIVKFVDEVIGESKETPYKTRTGSIQDIEVKTFYRKTISFIVHLKDQSAIK